MIGNHSSIRPGGVLLALAEHPTEPFVPEKPKPLSEPCRKQSPARYAVNGWAEPPPLWITTSVR